MKRGGPLKRKAPMRARTRDRAKARARWERNFGDQARLAWTKPCAVLVAGGMGCWGKPVAAHVRSRGAGGTAKDIAPLCWGHHVEQESMPLADFEAKYGVDLTAEAERLAREVRGE